MRLQLKENEREDTRANDTNTINSCKLLNFFPSCFTFHLPPSPRFYTVIFMFALHKNIFSFFSLFFCTVDRFALCIILYSSFFHRRQHRYRALLFPIHTFFFFGEYAFSLWGENSRLQRNSNISEGKGQKKRRSLKHNKSTKIKVTTYIRSEQTAAQVWNEKQKKNYIIF